MDITRTFLTKLPLNIRTTGIEARVISRDEFLRTDVEEIHLTGSGERNQPLTAVCMQVVVTGENVASPEIFAGSGTDGSRWAQDRGYRRESQTPPSGTAGVVVVCAAPHEGDCGRGAVSRRLPAVLTPENFPGEKQHFPIDDDVQTYGCYRLSLAADLFDTGAQKLVSWCGTCFSSSGSYVERQLKKRCICFNKYFQVIMLCVS
ncbi:hypothetical protein AVEN_117259-1 [Araneus ventricosus]|uniref:Uncharacterized protein n=1 Tax=Araneus ventricosus TaxID=182803 RepID=A0A4Y2AWT9_ARAVE|nr:hypothetical protein AVEN_117259-1 [Araneus ventricosus]